MMPRALLPSLALGLLLAGCADRPLALSCSPRRLADFEHPVAATDDGTYRAVLAARAQARLAARPQADGTGSPASPRRSTALVALSGGGQWGAFGAGFLTAWAAIPAGNPRARPILPDEVTGVSTGAIQATTVFLGPAYDEYLQSRYSIGKESQLVHDNGSLFILGHASIGNQAALVRYVTESLDGAHGDLIAEVAKVHDRQLYVGTVDALTGQMTRIDMTALARGFGSDRAVRDRCYVAAIVASAAIPIEFRQVTVDGRVYMDGGVRQSAFVADEVTRNLSSNKGFDHVFLMMNENITLSDKPDLRPTILNEVPYAIRAFVDQIQQASIHNISDYAEATGATAFYLRTDTPSDNCRASRGGNRFFDPGFMHCLILQGLHSDAATTWLPLSH